MKKRGLILGSLATVVVLLVLYQLENPKEAGNDDSDRGQSGHAKEEPLSAGTESRYGEIFTKPSTVSSSSSNSGREIVGFYESHRRILLAKYGDDFIRDALQKIQSENVQEIKEGLGVVRKFYIRDAIPHIEDLLYSNNPSISRNSLGILLQFNEEAGFNFLLQKLRSDEAKYWGGNLLDAFVVFNRQDYISELLEVMEARGSGSTAAAITLGRLGEPVSIDNLSVYMASNRLSEELAEAIIGSGDSEAASVLNHVFENPNNRESKLYAAWALESLGEKGYGNFLYSTMKQSSMIPSQNVIVDNRYVKMNPFYQKWTMNDGVTLREVEISASLLARGANDDAEAALESVAIDLSKQHPAYSQKMVRLLAEMKSEAARRSLLSLYNNYPDVSKSVLASALIPFDGKEVVQILVQHYEIEELEERRFYYEHMGWNGMFDQEHFY